MTKSVYCRPGVNGNRMRPRFDPGDRSRIEEAKSRVSVAAAWVALGCPGTPPKDGGNALSPFRQGDNKAAFGISGCGRLWHDRVTDTGGDVVSFIVEVMRCTRADAFRTLYRIAGMDTPHPNAARQWPVAPPPVPVVKEAAVPKKTKPLPQLRIPTVTELSGYNRLRGLGPSWAGLDIMASRGLLFAGTSYDRTEPDEKGNASPVVLPAFIVTDPARRVAMIRRQDGTGWTHLDGAKSKTWAEENGSRRPVGAALLAGDFIAAPAVILCEGFPDLCAAHALAWDFHGNAPVGLRSVCIIAMVSASPSIAADALPLFAGRRVVIVPHCDGINPATGKDPGEAAAQKWAAQLHAAGASVFIFRLRDYLPPGGKDLCDAAAYAFAYEPAHDDSGTEPPSLTLSQHLFGGLPTELLF